MIMSFEEFQKQELEDWDKRVANYETLTAHVTTQAIPALLGAIRNRVGLKVLDVCTGPGFAAGAIGAIGTKSEGADFAPSMARIANERFPKLKFWEGDALALNVDNENYDAALCNLGVLHFTYPLEAFSEAFRALRLVGRCAFSQLSSPKEPALFSTVHAASQSHHSCKT